MKDYQKRVVKEKKELDKKHESLEIFLMGSESLSKVDRGLLVTQYSIMDAYSRILGMRINNFDK